MTPLWEFPGGTCTCMPEMKYTRTNEAMKKEVNYRLVYKQIMGCAQ